MSTDAPRPLSGNPLSVAVAGTAVTIVIAGPPRKATDEQIAQNYECSVFTALAAQWRNG
jgi:hypothetical protein